MVFETERLIVRAATEDDVEFYYVLWTNPDVMKHVGFPHGISLDLEEMKANPRPQGPTEFDRLLVVVQKDSGQPIGECKLSRPDDEGIAEPDIKLLSEYWGQGYGREIWDEVVAYQFTHTDCAAIQTTPNVENVAAIKLYESVGAVCEGEDVYHFPENMRSYTTPVHCYIYRLYRTAWQTGESSQA